VIKRSVSITQTTARAIKEELTMGEGWIQRWDGKFFEAKLINHKPINK
jgi:hypothetical protein